MWWYNRESNETIYKLMKEYHLSWGEYFEATQGPTCILPMRDPITGERMFPKKQILPEEELEKLKREMIEDYYNHCDLEAMKEVIEKKYNMYGDYFYRILGNDMSDFEYIKPIKIRKKWCLKIEKYFKNNNKEYKYVKNFMIDNIPFTVSDLSVQTIKEKLNYKNEEEAKECLESIKKSFIATPNGLRRKERDDTSYSELFIKVKNKEKIYAKVIKIIKEGPLEKISKSYLMKKLKLKYNAVNIIMDVLIDKGYVEESKDLGLFNVIR